MSMKQNDIKALRDMSVSELSTKLVQAEKQLADIRLAAASGKQPKQSVSLLSDDVARIKTVLGKKQAEENVA